MPAALANNLCSFDFLAVAVPFYLSLGSARFAVCTAERPSSLFFDPSSPLFPWPRMEGWIRRGWIPRFWGAPTFSREVPK